ncbi:hypothetical protein ACQBAU_16905 [Propionibacteriaceae bacterium Y2011]|uniref:hypothetical protein n=1 Tax=Microlunatus sp. Y2014 TaxID=3418488 RepID=UPI003B4C5B58
MRTLKRAVHFDLHTMPGIGDFGADFDAPSFARTLRDSHVDFVNVFAKCNIGFAYYPTEIGIPYPTMTGDMLGETIAACQAEGIGVTAYFNAMLDHEMARRHREWTVVNADGQVIHGDRTKNFFRNMCIHTPWRAHLLAMITEVVDRYPTVDGIFLDCIQLLPCHGDECASAVAEAGGDPTDPAALREYATQGWVDFCREVGELVGPDRFLYPNGLPWHLGDEFRTHGEIECLPGAWGYDFFPARVAYARNIDEQVLYMTGRFSGSWGEFGGLKSEASIRNDCWDAIANAAQPSIGDHLHPRGHLEAPVYDIVKRVYAEIEALEPWTIGAQALADVAVLANPDRTLSPAHDGLARMLGEAHVTFDVVDDRHDLSPYALLILPDDITLTGPLADKVAEHVAAGRPVLSSGRSALRPDHDGFALPEHWPFAHLGPEPSNTAYFSAPAGTVAGLPDMPTIAGGQGILLGYGDDVEVIAERVESYHEQGWDGFHGYFYTPPKGPSGNPAVVRHGSVVHVAFPLFTSYLDNPMPAYTAVLRDALGRLLPDPRVRTERIPSTARVTLTRLPGRTMCHVKLTHPEPRGAMNVVDALPTLADGRVSIRATPSRVHLALGEDLPYRQVGDRVEIDLPRVDGYALVVLED